MGLSFSPAAGNAATHLARGSLAVLLAALLPQCSTGPRSEVVVSVKDQKLGLYESGHLKKTYKISTSKFGLGDEPNSYRTPLGKHEVIAKIGHGLPKGAVLKSRSWNGEVLEPNAPGRDPIVSRILWLKGLESSNSNAHKRFIYIHGTTEESNLGKPASYGCIRMGMSDVVEVFDEVGVGAKVVVTKDRLPHGGRLPKDESEEQPESTPEADGSLLAGDAKESKKTEAGAAAAEVEGGAAGSRITPPVPILEDPKPAAKSKSSKGFLGLFKRGRDEPAAEVAEVAAPMSAPGTGPSPVKKVKKPAAAPEAPPQIKIGPEVPAPEALATQKEPDKAAKSFFSLKNKWPLRRNDRAESAG